VGSHKVSKVQIMGTAKNAYGSADEILSIDALNHVSKNHARAFTSSVIDIFVAKSLFGLYRRTCIECLVVALAVQLHGSAHLHCCLVHLSRQF